MRHAIVATLLLAAGTACTTTTVGTSLGARQVLREPPPELGAPADWGGGPLARGGVGLAEAVEFDHGCPPARVRLIRSGPGAVDVDVCGAVRRYRYLDGRPLDVTALFPASSLPAPLPPGAPAAATDAGGAVGAEAPDEGPRWREHP